MFFSVRCSDEERYRYREYQERGYGERHRDRSSREKEERHRERRHREKEEGRHKSSRRYETSRRAVHGLEQQSKHKNSFVEVAANARNLLRLYDDAFVVCINHQDNTVKTKLVAL